MQIKIGRKSAKNPIYVENLESLNKVDKANENTIIASPNRNIVTKNKNICYGSFMIIILVRVIKVAVYKQFTLYIAMKLNAYAEFLIFKVDNKLSSFNSFSLTI